MRGTAPTMPTSTAARSAIIALSRILPRRCGAAPSHEFTVADRPPAAPLPPISCLQDDERPWLPMDASLPGLAIKYLHINVAEDEMTVLLRMPVGLALPRHRHDGAVFVYTLQGEWRYREYDWIARPGSTVLEPAGSHHTPEAIASETGAVVTFNVMRGDLVLLDDAGNETARENGRVGLLRERKFARAKPDVAPPFVTR